jgi:capsular polysaccharide biosynthesis protein
MQLKRRLAHIWFDTLRPSLGWALALVFRRLPIPSSVLGPPKNVIWDAGAYVESRRQKLPLGSWGDATIPLQPNESFAFAGAPPAHPAFAGRMSHTFHAVSVTRLERGRLALSEGVVVSPDDRVFDEFTHNWGDSIWRHPVLRRAKMPTLQRRAGVYATIVTPGAQRNYCHWLWDAIPRIALLEQAGQPDWKLIISNRVRPWQADSLAMLGYSPERCVEFGDEYWDMDSLLVPSFHHDTGYIHPRAVEWMRARFLPGQTAKPDRRIFLSRKKAPRRRLLNEAEIVDALKHEGFEEIVAEELSFPEQVNLFSQAHIIVAPHGAGLANLLFAPEGARIVELFSPRYVNPCFFSLSLVLRQPYTSIVGQTEATGPTNDLVTMAEDFIVAPEEVLSAVQVRG